MHNLKIFRNKFATLKIIKWKIYRIINVTNNKMQKYKTHMHLSNILSLLYNNALTILKFSSNETIRKYFTT